MRPAGIEPATLDPANATAPHGYLFDNVTTETRNTDGPGGCGAPATATLNVTKFYDANANGTKDGTEPDITGWKVQVANGSTLSGTTPFTASGLLAPGDYTASESSPNEATWYPITPTSRRSSARTIS